MYLFVWEDVLTDWTSGIAFALAPDIETAKRLLIDGGVSERSWDGYLLDGEKATIHPTTGASCAYHVAGGS